MSHCYDNYAYQEYTRCYLKLIKQIIKFQTSSTLYNIKNRKNKQYSEKRNFKTIKNTLEENLKKIQQPAKGLTNNNTKYFLPTCTCHSVSSISSVTSASKWSIRISTCRIVMTIMSTKSTLVVIWKMSTQIIKFQTSSTLYNVMNRKNKQYSEKRNFKTIKNILEENLKKYNNQQKV